MSGSGTASGGLRGSGTSVSGGAHHAQRAAIRAPRDVGHVARQPRDLARLTPVHGQQPDLRAALLGRLGHGRPIGGTGGLEDRGAVAQEGEAASIGAPAGRGVAAPAERQRSRRRRAVGGHDPQRVPIAVASGCAGAQGEDDLRPVRRETDLGRDAQVEQVIRARRARHRVTSSGKGCGRPVYRRDGGPGGPRRTRRSGDRTGPAASQPPTRPAGRILRRCQRLRASDRSSLTPACRCHPTTCGRCSRDRRGS